MKLLNRLLNVGILDRDNRIESFRKILTNSMSLLGVVLNLLVFSIYVFVKPEVSLIYLFTAFLFSFPLILNYKAFYKISSLTILSINALVIIGLSFVGGFSIGIHPMLIVISMCGSLLLLSFHHAFIFNLLLLIGYFIAKNYSAKIGPLINNEVWEYREYLNFSLSIIAAFIISRFILKNLIRYIKNLEDTLDNLKETNLEIANQNQRLELFNSIASHDLKTPIRNFTSFVTLAKRDIYKENEESKSIDHLDMALSYSSRMNELINSISSLGDIKRVSSEDILQIDLKDFINESMSFYQKQTKKKLIVNCIDSIFLKARMSHCKIIINNIITNAIKYNKNEEIIIDINRSIENNILQIKIKDNGIGIQEDYQQIIFNPFNKLHTKDEYDGTGLGLFIVKEVLDIYGGDIYVEESSDKGTTFTIELPQSTQKSPLS